MTTIAYKDGVMAADTGLYAGNMVYGRVQKVFRLSNGSLFGAAGDGDIRRLVALLDARGHEVTQQELYDCGIDVNGMLVLPDGRIYLIDTDFKKDEPKVNDMGVYEVVAPFQAVGSGDGLAMAAMAAGASAERAIEITSDFNVFTVLPVYSMRLHD